MAVLKGKGKKVKSFTINKMVVWKRVRLLSNHHQSRALCWELGQGGHGVPLWLYLEAPVCCSGSWYCTSFLLFFQFLSSLS